MALPGGQHVDRDPSPLLNLPASVEQSSPADLFAFSSASSPSAAPANRLIGPAAPNSTAAAHIAPHILAGYVEASHGYFNTAGRDVIIINNYPSPGCTSSFIMYPMPQY